MSRRLTRALSAAVQMAMPARDTNVQRRAQPLDIHAVDDTWVWVSDMKQ